MTVRKNAVAALAAASMIVMPGIAQAADGNKTVVSKQSVSAPVAREGAKVSKKNKLAGGSVIIALIAVTAVIGGVVVAADGSNSPSSP